MIPVRVTSSALHTNYAPCYLAQLLGFFRSNGLEVDTSIPAGPGSSWLASNLIDDKADFAMGGIWIPLAYRHRLAELPISLLVCHRNPQLILSRAPVADFTWQSLYDSKMVLSMSATSQWMFLEGSMKKAGADPNRVAFLRDLDVATTLRLWRGGLGDFFLVDPLTAEALEEDGYIIATSMADLCGAVPWSVYYTHPRVLARPDGMAGRFADSLQQALDWLHAHDDDEVADVIAPLFADAPKPRIARSIRRLRADGVWRKDTRIPQEPFNAYQRIIADFGLIDRPFPFSDVVTYPTTAIPQARSHAV